MLESEIYPFKADAFGFAVIMIQIILLKSDKDVSSINNENDHKKTKKELLDEIRDGEYSFFADPLDEMLNINAIVRLDANKILQKYFHKNVKYTV